MPPSAYALGVFFIVLVALIWAASSVLVQYLYSDAVSFDSPFLLTYIGVSLFTLWLPIKFVWTTCCIPEKQSRSPVIGGVELSSSAGSTTVYDSLPSGEIDFDDFIGNDSDNPSAQNEGPNRREQEEVWTHAQHRDAALYIAPVWFLANWTYNASLAYTSITSSTVLASTGSLFTFFFAVCTKDEGFGWVKLTGVLLCVLGSMLTAWQDREDPGHKHDGLDLLDSPSTNGGTALFGDLLGLVSAVGYGAYAVQTHLFCPHNEELYSMQLLLGYIGLFNMVALSPIAVYLLLSGTSSDNNPLTLVVFGFLVVKGLFDNVLSDYLWLRAVILTSATVATVGLGLTIPLAFASDFVLGKSSHGLTAGTVIGALFVLLGFCLVNIGNDDIGAESVVVEMAANDHEEEASHFQDHNRHDDKHEEVSDAIAIDSYSHHHYGS
jgi:solute carrier family 35 protein F5